MKKSIVATDICNTLYDANTTFDFFKYLASTPHLNSWQKFIYKVVISRKSILFLPLAILQKITKKDFHKRIIIGFLKNKEISQVQQWANDYVKNYLIHKEIKPTLAIIAEAKKEELVLVSATIEPVAAAIAERLHAKYIATRLEIKKNKYTGKIAKELTGEKLKELQSLYGIDLSLRLAMSDNITDYSLLENASRKIAVCYTVKQEQFWLSIPGIEILRV